MICQQARTVSAIMVSVGLAQPMEGKAEPSVTNRLGTSWVWFHLSSTLLRGFRRELGCTPAAYWRDRRLDEALVLLRSGRHQVAEVAATVGYDNPTSFGWAFRRRFKRAPSTFVPKRPLRPAP